MQLAGLAGPYIDLVTDTFDNVAVIGTHWLTDPLPVLTQVAANWFGYLQLTVDSVGAAGRAFVDGLANLPDQLQTLFSAATDGDFEAVLAESLIIALSINPIPALIDQLLAIPYDIAGNLVSAGLAALHAAQVPIGTAAFSAAQATIAEFQVVAQDFVDDLRDGNLAGALGQVVVAPALILNAALNGDNPGLFGLLTPFRELNQTGLVDAVVNYLPRTVAHAIGADFDFGTPPDPIIDTALLFEVSP